MTSIGLGLQDPRAGAGRRALGLTALRTRAVRLGHRRRASRSTPRGRVLAEPDRNAVEGRNAAGRVDIRTMDAPGPLAWSRRAGLGWRLALRLTVARQKLSSFTET